MDITCENKTYVYLNGLESVKMTSKTDRNKVFIMKQMRNLRVVPKKYFINRNKISFTLLRKAFLKLFLVDVRNQ